jgi:hypothetical protein
LGHIRLPDGEFVDLQSASYEIVPPVLTPGEKAVFYVDLIGDHRLATSDLSDIKAYIDNQATTLQVDKILDGTRKSTISLAFSFIAPKELGPHLISVQLPGVANLEDYALILDSN